MKYRKLVIYAASVCLAVSLVIPVRAAGGFVGSSRGDVYHLPDCYHVDEIAPGNLIWWHNEEDAARYRRPCNDCRPDRNGKDFYYGNTSQWSSENPRIQLGFEQEYKDGIAEGKRRGYNSGYDDGLDDGYDTGYDAGHTDGYDVGREYGRTEGYETGCADGYESGYQAASEEYQTKLDSLKSAHAEELADKQWEAVGATVAGVGVLAFAWLWIKEWIASRNARKKTSDYDQKPQHPTKPRTSPQPKIQPPPVVTTEANCEPQSDPGPKPEPRTGALSGVIREFWHENGVLYVTFTSGGTLCYQNVPLYVYLHMRSEESAEDYLRDQVTGIYKCIPYKL